MIEPFGDSQELADELIDLVIHGPKRATAAALADFHIEHRPTPEPGHVSIATDGRGNEFDPEMPTVFERFEVIYTE